MLNLGEKQVLTVVKRVDFGIYLAERPESETRVLLPVKQAPEGVEIGDELEVFLYRDSGDRLIATTRTPYLTMGRTAVLKVSQTGDIGAFLDWGLEKDLFLPFKEQTWRVREGEECLAALYIDKSARLCATMKVYPYLYTDSPYNKDDRVRGRIYEKSQEFGTFVAVDDRYSALIPKKEEYGELRPGQIVEARVSGVKEDGKLDLSVREKAYLQMDRDAERVMGEIEARGGELPLTDRSSPEEIKNLLSMSKNAYKRAVGRLLKEGRVEFTDTCVRKRQTKPAGSAEQAD